MPSLPISAAGTATRAAAPAPSANARASTKAGVVTPAGCVSLLL